jgi:hypothetical protein
VRKALAARPAEDIAALPVTKLAAPNYALFLWTCWPNLKGALDVIDAWGFTYKGCAFDWTKADSATLTCSPTTTRRRSAAATGRGRTPSNTGSPRAAGPSGSTPTCAKRSSPRGASTVANQPASTPASSASAAGPYLELLAREIHSGWDRVGQ